MAVPPTRRVGDCWASAMHSSSFQFTQDEGSTSGFIFSNLIYVSQTFKFKVIPFGLLTAPMEFAVMVKEVKLISQNKDIRIHQFLNEWLIGV